MSRRRVAVVIALATALVVVFVGGVILGRAGESDDDSAAPATTGSTPPSSERAPTTDPATTPVVPPATAGAPATPPPEGTTPDEPDADDPTETTAVAAPATSPPAPPQLRQAPGTEFVADFSTPEDFFDRFDWHWGMLPDPRTFDIPAAGLTNQADHSLHSDGQCGPPTESRTVHLRVPDEQVYWCGPKGPESGHIMTATPYTGYGILSFSPKQTFTDIERVCWDQNLTSLGGRRWTMMQVVPKEMYDENYPRLDYAAAGFGRDPDENVGADNLDSPNGGVMARVFVGSLFWYPDLDDGPADEQEAGMIGGIIEGNKDKATRYTHCVIDNGDDTVTLTQERPDGTTASGEMPGSFPDGDVHVIFQDDRYDTSFEDSPITWHWDDIVIS